MGKRKHVVNLLFTVTLLGVFALAAIFVATMGANVYSNSASKMQDNFNTRTSLVYISEKVRQTPGENYEVRKVGDSDALVLFETFGDNEFETWIYQKDGKLCELMVQAEADISKFSGQQIMDMEAISFEKTPYLLKVTVKTVDGKEESLSIGRRSWQ